VRNSLRITKAQLGAERTNAELMLAIIKQMNLAGQIEDVEAKIVKYQDKLADEELELTDD
jgi:hypothetical protein